jgi:hypothetical protein
MNCYSRIEPNVGAAPRSPGAIDSPMPVWKNHDSKDFKAQSLLPNQGIELLNSNQEDSLPASRR